MYAMTVAVPMAVAVGVNAGCPVVLLTYSVRYA